MPVTIACDDETALDFDEFVERLHEARIDTADDDAMISVAPLLRRLGNNRDFLAARVVDELTSYRTMQEGNNYGSQAFLLDRSHRPGQNFFLRACFWPAAEDQMMKVSGAQPFTYHQPHDHNFNFLTLGYAGPGYWSNYYDYDRDAVVGYVGEKVDLRFVEKANLALGKVLLYRASVDVHDQLPPERFSVSLNVLENNPRVRHLDQFEFDVDAGRIRDIVNRLVTDMLFDVLAFHGRAEDRELLADIGRRHASARIRCCAWQSLANGVDTPAQAIEVLRQVPATAPRLVRDWAAHRLRQLEPLAGP